MSDIVFDLKGQTEATERGIKGPLEPAHSCDGQFLLCPLLLVI